MAIDVEGDINTDYRIGRTREGRAGFQAIRMKVKIDAGMTREAKEKFIHSPCASGRLFPHSSGKIQETMPFPPQSSPSRPQGSF
jgi:hypothetical protein